MVLGIHRPLMNGCTNSVDVGCYRTDTEIMQIISGAVDAPQVHDKASPTALVLYEMFQFMEWLSQTEPKGSHSLTTVSLAGLAHLRLESKLDCHLGRAQGDGYKATVTKRRLQGI